jgi:hypothetical protein
VAAFVRIGWPLSIGIGGRLPSESVAALPRIPHSMMIRASDPPMNLRLFAESAILSSGEPMVNLLLSLSPVMLITSYNVNKIKDEIQDF